MVNRGCLLGRNLFFFGIATFAPIIGNVADESSAQINDLRVNDIIVSVNDNEIFEFIYKRLNRTYLDINIFVEKLDRLSLEKKRQLTIPLIKEII